MWPSLISVVKRCIDHRSQFHARHNAVESGGVGQPLNIWKRRPGHGNVICFVDVTSVRRLVRKPRQHMTDKFSWDSILSDELSASNFIKGQQPLLVIR
jgi:hypothetical protein